MVTITGLKLQISLVGLDFSVICATTVLPESYLPMCCLKPTYIVVHN